MLSLIAIAIAAFLIAYRVFAAVWDSVCSSWDRNAAAEMRRNSKAAAALSASRHYVRPPLR